MKKTFLLLTIFSLFGLSSIITKAQGTLKNTTIAFSGENRDISIYVSSDYTSSSPAKLLIGLHGLGDNCKNYVEGMIDRFSESLMPNTIIICPDGGSDIFKDFYTPQGDEEVIDAVITYAKNNYNIDASQIILQGFSLGGKSALKYGLDFPDKFKALILNTPAIQGVKEAVTEGNFKYTNASKIPIYITHGEEDVNYKGPIDSMRLQLIRNNGKVLYRQFPIGHTIPTTNQMIDLNQFINSLYISDYDLDIVHIDIPKRTCETSVPFSVLVQNKGAKNLTSIKFSYIIDKESPSSYTWTGNLAPFQHLKIDFPNLNKLHGTYTFTVRIDSLNNSYKDTVEYNNSVNTNFDIATQPKVLPYIQTFSHEDMDDEWLYISAGDYFPRVRLMEPGYLWGINSAWDFENMGRKNEVVSPLIDLSSIKNPSVAFDVAYTYTVYTEDFLGQEMTFADTLEVLITTDCGKTYESIYKKGGKDLLTFKKPLTNVVDINSLMSVFPESGDWRRIGIDLSPYLEYTSAAIKFSYISAQGGVIFLDNMAFSNEIVSIKEIESQSISVYPNPAQNHITINTGHYSLKSVCLYDIFGRKVKSYDGSSESTKIINVTDMTDGIYIVELITTCGKKLMKKIIVKH